MDHVSLKNQSEKTTESHHRAAQWWQFEAHNLAIAISSTKSDACYHYS